LEWHIRDEGGASDRSRENLSSRSNDSRQKTSKPIGDIATSKADRQYCLVQNKSKSKRESKLKTPTSSSNDGD